MPTFPIGTPTAVAGAGRTIGEWQAKVAELIRDAANVDFTPSQITTVGIAPAVAQYSVDRPRTVFVEAAGTGSPYLALPSGWVHGFSSLTAVEFPARMNPTRMLDSQSWDIVHSASDITVEQILLDRTPVASQYVRLTFTTRWPMPTTTAADDLIDDIAYEAVTALAASFCCVSAAGEGARARWGVLPTDSTDQEPGSQERTQRLLKAADSYRATYDRLLGLDAAREAPAYGSFDFDDQWQSVFHGGRR